MNTKGPSPPPSGSHAVTPVGFPLDHSGICHPPSHCPVCGSSRCTRACLSIAHKLVASWSKHRGYENCPGESPTSPKHTFTWRGPPAGSRCEQLPHPITSTRAAKPRFTALYALAGALPIKGNTPKGHAWYWIGVVRGATGEGFGGTAGVGLSGAAARSFLPPGRTGVSSSGQEGVRQ